MPTSYPTFRWLTTLALGLYFLVGNVVGVSVARDAAWEVNGIALSAWWYLFAFPPALSILAAIAYRRSHAVWQGDCLFMTLNVLNLASMIHMPLLYSLGGFE